MEIGGIQQAIRGEILKIKYGTTKILGVKNAKNFCFTCAQHGRNLTSESPEHALVVRSV